MQDETINLVCRRYHFFIGGNKRVLILYETNI